MNVNDNTISNELKINHLLPKKQISYSSYSVICENLYNDIKNKSEISNCIIGLLLEMSHVRGGVPSWLSVFHGPTKR